MHAQRLTPIFLIIALISFAPSTTQGDDEAVVPSQEKEIAQNLGVAGPTETKGIESSIVLGSIGLGEDFEALNGRSLRARKVSVLPGGIVGVHQHTTRPGVLYMLEGELTEFRNNHDSPLIRQKGDSSFEKDGVIHWWRNDSSESAVVLIVDIVPDEST